MHGDKVRRFQKHIEGGSLDLRVEVQSPVDGEIGVVAEHVHAESDSRVRHVHADGAESDHAQSLAGDLMSHKTRFALFDNFGKTFRAL